MARVIEAADRDHKGPKPAKPIPDSGRAKTKREYCPCQSRAMPDIAKRAKTKREYCPCQSRAMPDIAKELIQVHPEDHRPHPSAPRKPNDHSSDHHRHDSLKGTEYKDHLPRPARYSKRKDSARDRFSPRYRISHRLQARPMALPRRPTSLLRFHLQRPHLKPTP
ncbi:hypothetical protein QE152_g8024 [Popillia japonica]|uniref:Uncharacterized protein n=1 Tax=Popillia japonica TaxID=7064 RepID=A0AAW1M680_POPJA